MNFIRDQIDRLGSFQIRNDQILWHYTTGEALIDIVRSGTLFATQVSCLNDSTEINYSEDLLVEAFRQVREQQPHDESTSKLLEILASRPASLVSITAPSWWFVTCFTDNGDDLSQWRAYAGGENGYAIGFHVGGLLRPQSAVIRVNYDYLLHADVAESVAIETLSRFKAAADADRTLSAETWLEAHGRNWSATIGDLAPLVKHPGFAGERECRIVHKLTDQDLNDIVVRQKRSLMARHLPLTFPQTAAGLVSMLPIANVRVGPSRHADVSRVSVGALLKRYGYDVGVSLSRIPYQAI